MDGLLRTARRVGSLALLLFFTVGQASPSGCGTKAMIYDPPSFDFVLHRILTATPPFQTDNATAIDVPVSVVGAVSGNGQYKFKIGAEGAIDCSKSAAYSSTWTSTTKRLQAEISDLPDGVVELCLVGRKPHNSASVEPESVEFLPPSSVALLFSTQPFSQATRYRWVKDTTGPAEFSINPLETPSNNNAPLISWQAATDAVSYSVAISTSQDCSEPFQIYNNIAATSITTEPIPDGSYHVCVAAKDAYGNTTNAANNGVGGVIDTVPPAPFSVLSPSGNVSGTQQLASWTVSADASHYRLRLASDAACSDTLNDWENVTGTELTIEVPAAGTFYLCAQAFDAANNMVAADPSAFTVAVAPEELVLKDHATNPSCWDNNQALYHYNDPGESDGIVAASIVGGGGLIKRVGGIFVDASCSSFNTGVIENMDVHVAFYESPAVFIADPYLRNQPAGSPSRMVSVTRSITPRPATPSGTERFYVEADVGAFNLRTTAGQEHIVAIWFSSDEAADGQTWMALSQGCAGHIGTTSDYYRTENNQPPLGPGSLQEIGASTPYAAYFVTELAD